MHRKDGGPTRHPLLKLQALAVLLAAVPMTVPAQTDLDLRVMSFNVRYGTADDGINSWPLRRDLVVRVIADQAPDVLGMQEALDFQLNELMSAIDGYGLIGVGRDDGRTRGEYAAILYRLDRLALEQTDTFWFSDTPEVPGSTSWGNHITRICTWARFVDRESAVPFYVYNVHLDHESQDSRERSVELLAERIALRTHPDPVIVTGDFNAGEQNSAMRFLRGEADRAWGESDTPPPSPNLIDTFRRVHPDATETGTFNGFRGITSGERIDAVLVSRDWSVLDAAIVRTSSEGRYPSDHFPVLAVLQPNLGPQ